MEDDRVSLLEQQLAQAKLIAEEADKKYEEVGHEPANEKKKYQSFRVEPAGAILLLIFDEPMIQLRVIAHSIGNLYHLFSHFAMSNEIRLESVFYRNELVTCN